MTSLLERLRFRLALWLWARWLPILAYQRDLQSLTERALPPPRVRYTHLEPAYIVKHVRRAVRKPWVMRDRPCLRQGLLAYRFLSLAGYQPELHFGVDQTSIAASRLSAHCWIVLDGRTILNEPEKNMIKVLILRTGGDGQSRLDALGA